MKKMMCMLAMGISATMFADENLILNGSFENVSKIPKASSKYILGQTKKGWDFGLGPVAKVPRNWTPNYGKIKSTVIEIGENGENKENVAEGKVSMHFSGENFHMYNGANLKPGKYTISFKCKGSGTVAISFYGYSVDPVTRKAKHLVTKAPFSVKAKPEWQIFTKTIEIGTEEWAPGISKCTLALTGFKCNVYIDDISVTKIKDDTNR